MVIMHPYKKQIFTFEDSVVPIMYVGYNNGSTFKSYETPLFTKEECDKIIDEQVPIFGYTFATYNEEKDYYMCSISNDELEGKTLEELEVLLEAGQLFLVEPKQIEVEGEMIKVYGFGCDWTWEIFDEKESFEYGELSWEEAWQMAAKKAGWINPNDK